MPNTHLSQSKSRRDLAASLRGSRTRKHARRRHRLLQAEQLEDRRLLSLSPLDSIPVLNSNSSASASLYLDFNGHFEPVFGSYTNVTTPVYDVDGDKTTFSDVELANIESIWTTVAEDYAPFNINVTTVEPSVLAPGVPIANANKVALRVAIGGTADVLTMGSGLAGYGYYNSFTSSTANVAYVFSEGVLNQHPAIMVGNCASHEAGHSFGLRHQSTAFYSTWQGIMYGVLVYDDAWWTTGTDDLGNFQDDMAMLANSLNGFGLRADDHAGTIAGATPLVGSGTNFSGSGVIGVGGDADVWSLTTSGTNAVQVKVEGSVVGQNLDAAIDFLDSAGNVILTANPTASNDAELIVEATGTQYLVVRSTGEYGRVGGYTVSVTESQPGVSVVSQSELYTSELGISDTFSLSLKSKPTADVRIDISSSDSSEGTVAPTQLVFTSANWYLPQAVTVRGTEDSVVDGVVRYAVNLGPTSSADVHYDGVTIDSIAAVNADNDVPGWAFELESTDYVLVNDLEVAADGSLFVMGTFARTTDFNPGPATTNVTAARFSDAFIAKYSPSQELLWVRPFGTAAGYTDARSIDLDSAGNLYVVGNTSSSSLTLGSTTLATRGLNDAFAAKLDNDGNFVWAKSWGSTGDDLAYALFIDANDRLHVGGYYSGTVDFDPASTTMSRTSVGGCDAFVSRLDSNGNFLSVTSVGGVNNDFLRELVGDTNGNVFAAGYFSGTSQFGSHSLTSAGGTDSYFFKLNAVGAVEWAHQAAGIPSGTSAKLAVTSTGDVFFSGSFSEDVNFGPGTTVLSSAGLSDVFLTKWSTDGNLLQAGQLSGPATMGIAGLKVDATDQPVVYGYFAGTVDMDPTSETVTRTSLDAGADFILRLDANTRFLDFYQMPRDVGSPRALALDNRGNIYVSGDIRTTLAMPTGEVFRNAEGSYDAYVLKLAVAPGITIGSSIGLATSENGGSAPLSVVLDTPPTGDVTIAVTSRDTSEGVVSPSTLTFTPANWNIPQVVMITGVDDTLFDGDVVYSVDLSVTSLDPGYNGLQPSSVSVKNLDNDVPPTKFYVVDDASANRTYEYAANGAVVENYSLGSGNTAPRGAASTIAGDKTWVVDANRKVYVYNNSGGLLGSWTAGTLASNATVEGIATNGTDIWIVDAKSDKVYRYTNAASRLSGSQTAASSFSLNSSNTSPKDIVTDGTSIWVVNDSSTDKVFKYSVTGSLAGSWTISSGGGSPTGITIDPSNATQDIWIVDSGTDKVYQYTAGRSRTSGSHAADLSFPLAVGNTNPQGIADPPAPSSVLTTETPVPSEPISAEAAVRGSDAALENMYDVPVKKVRIDTVQRSESRAVESHTRDLSYTVGASANRIANDSVANDKHHAEVDDLFAEWDSDPLGLLSLPDLGE